MIRLLAYAPLAVLAACATTPERTTVSKLAELTIVEVSAEIVQATAIVDGPNDYRKLDCEIAYYGADRGRYAVNILSSEFDEENSRKIRHLVHLSRGTQFAKVDGWSDEFEDRPRLIAPIVRDCEKSGHQRSSTW